MLVSSSQIYLCARDWPMPEGTWSALEASLTKFHFFKSFRKTKIFDLNECVIIFSNFFTKMVGKKSCQVQNFWKRMQNLTNLAYRYLWIKANQSRPNEITNLRLAPLNRELNLPFLGGLGKLVAIWKPSYFKWNISKMAKFGHLGTKALTRQLYRECNENENTKILGHVVP